MQCPHHFTELPAKSNQFYQKLQITFGKKPQTQFTTTSLYLFYYSPNRLHRVFTNTYPLCPLCHHPTTEFIHVRTCPVIEDF
ncbi:hypothetical protein XELAEV_18037542mg [Xenopus laevis]|uniref:Uncharacterized protein n=1 Tax=Xenopus laevis TaxID=8355 RepID=A0A974CCI4_XENLA|nr:hypothetical protein XELAEV_18037542mg [Xenopus laevis]